PVTSSIWSRMWREFWPARCRRRTALACASYSDTSPKASKTQQRRSTTMAADELQHNVAVSCRILGMLGLVSGTTGHVSARIPGSDEMWVRCRGGDEYGLTFTGLHNIRRLDFDGTGPGLDSTHASPNGTPIHGEIYRAKPQAQAVVHAHPPYALLCGI